VFDGNKRIEFVILLTATYVRQQYKGKASLPNHGITMAAVLSCCLDSRRGRKIKKYFYFNNNTESRHLCISMETRSIVGSERHVKTYSTKETLFSFHVNNV
jgi:hypothetical protein